MIDEDLYKKVSDARAEIGKALAILHGNGHKDRRICQAIKEATEAHHTLLDLVGEYLQEKGLA